MSTKEKLDLLWKYLALIVIAILGLRLTENTNSEYISNNDDIVVFGDNIPKISSTKSLTGHSLGATGVHEAIYCLLMMNNNFLSGSANIDNLDSKAENFNILLNTKNNEKIQNIMSNSFGFGGTNATLIFSKYNA